MPQDNAMKVSTVTLLENKFIQMIHTNTDTEMVSVFFMQTIYKE